MKQFIIISIIIFLSVFVYGQNILLDNDFDTGIIGTGWISLTQAGNTGYQIGIDSDINGNGIGSYVYFDDNDNPAAPPSRVQLVSPTFDGLDDHRIELELQVNFKNRTYQLDSCQSSSGYKYGCEYDTYAHFTTAVVHGSDTTIVLVYQGTETTAFINHTIDLTYLKDENMHLLFTYDDNEQHTNWVAFDNITVTGYGELNDHCKRAIALGIGLPCTAGNNIGARLERDPSGCADAEVHGVWYKFKAPASGMADVIITYPDLVNLAPGRDTAALNDVLTVFKGRNQIACTNDDEFGFTGEHLRLTGLTHNKWYHIRVSGADCTYGSNEGLFCIRVEDGTPPPAPPANDACNQATPLTIGGGCQSGTNIHANLETPSSCGTHEQADVWYSFQVPAGTDSLSAHANAEYAHTMALYTGTCPSLTEVACEAFHCDAEQGFGCTGNLFKVNGLASGTTYYLKVSALFATLEGGLCVSVGSDCLPFDAPCDDGNSLTYDDKADGNCGCSGIACPVANTNCEDGRDNTFNDIWDGACNCSGTYASQGSPCDDGDPATINDTWDGNGICSGTCIIAGTPCDDGNPDTDNDQWDGYCECVGTPVGECGQDVFVNEPLHTANPVVFSSIDSLKSSSIVAADADVTYTAGIRIRLLSGFAVQPDGRFHGKIEPCSIGNALMMADNSDEPLQLSEADLSINDDSQEESSHRPEWMNAVQVFNYPNPFKNKTAIRYYLPRNSQVKLSITNTQGIVLKEVINTDNQTRGIYNFDFNASHLPSGMYLYHLMINEEVFTGKMILLK